MPFLERPNGIQIYYEVKGTGSIPVLLLAPGGMRSSIPCWETRGPYNPWTSLLDSKYTLIGMDQRFANRSIGPVRESDGWGSFMDDQIALLDFLKIERCHLVGSCIGPSFCFNLLRNYKDRFGRCVMMQPIGLAYHTNEPDTTWDGLNTQAAWAWFEDWAMERIQSKKYKSVENMDLFKGLYERMFQNGRDFVFTISRDEATIIQTPILVLMGRDISHPQETAREICRLCPNSQLIETWRNAGPDALASAAAKIDTFLSAEP